MLCMFDYLQIAAELRSAGLDARAIDGLVYVALPGDRVLCIWAEFGASLFGDCSPTPSWFREAAEDEAV